MGEFHGRLLEQRRDLRFDFQRHFPKTRFCGGMQDLDQADMRRVGVNTLDGRFGLNRDDSKRDSH
ncbi:hypothetical protein phiCbK_233 [Caulobacter phage phiCbK]|uniref:Uncharacterized protein n=1 Tax=Caulobacter phage phiCbK TaxID=2927985 RepID=J3UIL1_9CAUD|nr:hypothetical protein phiCbK_233 [Caulobacter phage phiCbK]